MKQNKLIYLIIFSLVFLGFTNGVKAGCCYNENGTWKYRDDLSGAGCASWATGRNYSSSTVNNSSECSAKNNVGKFCCNTTTGQSNGKPEGNCNGSTDKWTDETGCAAALDYNQHQCCDDAGNVIEAKNSGECNMSASNGFKWRTVYQCRALKMVCCFDGKSKEIRQSECNSEIQTGKKAKWISQAECEGLSEGTTRDSVASIDLQNPYVTPPTTTNPDGNSAGDNSNTAGSGATGTETMTVGFDCNDPSVKSLMTTLKTIYNLLRVAVPVILVILGSVDFLRATIAGKDDEIEKHRKRFINRLIIAGMIFMLLSVFQLTANVLQKAGVTDSKSWVECWNSIGNDE